MNEPKYFWHPERNNLLTISGAWPEDARKAQETLLRSKGFLLVANYKPPKSQMPFARVTERFTANDDGTATQEIVEDPRAIKLSQEKLLRHPDIVVHLQGLITAISTDADLSDWWANDMRYLRGSAMARKAMSIFGFSQETMEQIALECMA